MSKQRQALVVSPCPNPDFYIFRFPWRNNVGGNLYPLANETFKVYPGCTYAGDDYGKGAWLIPREGVSWLKEEALKLKLDFEYKVNGSKVGSGPLSKPLLPKGIYDYQARDAYRGRDMKRFLYAYEMGLGKTVTAIAACKLSKVKSILIICPAIVKEVWKDELAKWWRNCKARVKRVSYALLSRDEELQEGLVSDTWDSIIIDESHYIKNVSSKRSKSVARICDNNPDSMILALTGTPIGDNPRDLWNQLDTLFPERFGSYWKFCERYCQKKENTYRQCGYDFYGLREDTAEELRDRLLAVSSRVVKKDVASFLPPFTTTTIRVDGESCSPKEFTLEYTRVSRKQHEGVFMKWLDKSADVKVDAAVKWAKNALENRSSVAIMTHLRSTAKEIKEELEKGKVNVVLLTGDVTAKKRHALLKDAVAKDACVVCTMASVGTGINELVHYPHALFAELAYYPVEVLQAMARFYRLTSKYPVNIDFLAVPGSLDEAIILSLRTKIKNMNKVFKASSTEAGLESALQDSKEDLRKWQDRMQQIAAGMITERL